MKNDCSLLQTRRAAGAVKSIAHQRQRQRQTDRDRERERERQTDRRTETQIHSDTETQRHTEIRDRTRDTETLRDTEPNFLEEPACGSFSGLGLVPEVSVDNEVEAPESSARQ